MVLCQGLPRCLRLCVDPCMARHAQSLNSSLHAWPQNLEAFQTTRKRAKCPTCDFFDFCNHVSLIIPLPMVWILLTKPMQKSVTTVCLHCSFARLKNKHIGVLVTNVVTMNELTTLVPSAGYRTVYIIWGGWFPSCLLYTNTIVTPGQVNIWILITLLIWFILRGGGDIRNCTPKPKLSMFCAISHCFAHKKVIHPGKKMSEKLIQK